MSRPLAFLIIALILAGLSLPARIWSLSSRHDISTLDVDARAATIMENAGAAGRASEDAALRPPMGAKSYFISSCALPYFVAPIEITYYSPALYTSVLRKRLHGYHASIAYFDQRYAPDAWFGLQASWLRHYYAWLFGSDTTLPSMKVLVLFEPPDCAALTDIDFSGVWKHHPIP